MILSHENNCIYCFGVFEFDLRAAELRKSGVKVKLQEQPYQVLLKLLQHPGEIVSREELRSTLWQENTFVDFETGLNTAVRRLRDALGDSPDNPIFIEPLPRRGYKFIAPVEVLPKIDEDKRIAAGIVSKPSLQKRASIAAFAGVTAVLIVLGAISFFVLHFRSGSVPDKRVIFTFVPPDNTRFAEFDSVALSLDGRMLAFTATDRSGEQQLWMRPLGRTESRRFDGTNGASFPFWSSDGRSIGFFMNGKLRRIDVSGGPPETICDAANGRGGTWNRSGVIVFAPAPDSPLFQVRATGGEPKPVTRLDTSRQELTHRWPSFLPDGNHFLYMLRSARADNTGIYLGSLDSGRNIRILGDQSSAMLTQSPAGDGYLIFGRGDTLMSQRFDVNRNKLVGEPFQIAESVVHGLYVEPMLTAFSTSQQGVLAYVSGRPTDQLTWVDRTGARGDTLGAPGIHLGPSVSPDGKEVTVATSDSRTGIFALWRIDIADGKLSELTFNTLHSVSSVWSPDGSHIAFAANEQRAFNLYQRLTSGKGDQELLLRSSRWQFPTDWSPDGRFLLYYEIAPQSSRDIWALPLFGDRTPIPLVRTEHDERDAKFSPDGKWFVYSSDESGKREIYVQPFLPVANSTGKWKISQGGGSHPQWPRPGNEIYYLAPDHKIIAVQVRTATTFQFDAPRPLFDSGVVDDFRAGFTVLPGGRRFLVPTAIDHPGSPAATIVINWLSRTEN